jgi:hypothetical protein
LAGGAALAENAYVWRNGEVLRFEYCKSTCIVQPDENGKSVERQTEVSGVLILEIRSVSPAGASALLRLDSPHVTLPELSLFSSQYDGPQPQQGKSRAVARAIEGALKAARWNVNLAANGLLYLESRMPKEPLEWLKETENAGGWRKRFLEILPRILDQDLGLRVPSHDRDLLLYLGSAPPAAGNRKPDNLHPRREDVTVVSNDGEKAVLKFQRAAPKDRGEFLLPDMLRNEKISVVLTEVSTKEARAVFDVKLGMLDSLCEEYTAKLKYTYQPDLTLDQQVRVQYRLKRLHPSLTTP